MKNQHVQKLQLSYAVILIVTTISFFALDQAVKFFVEQNLTQKYQIIPDVFSLVLHHNQGVAWSISIPYLVQLMLFPLLIIMGGYYLYNNVNLNKLFSVLIVGVILGGAWGNFVDRLLKGYVVDYISISVFPVFNIADIGIVGGIFLLLVFYGKIRRV